MKGLYHANQFFYIDIGLELCPVYGLEEGIECASLEEIENYIDGLIIQVAIFKPNFKIEGSLDSNFNL